MFENNDVVMRAAEVSADHLEKIRKLFKSPVKITLLVRTPNMPDQDFMLTDDEFDEIRKALNRREEEDNANSH